MSCGVGYGQLGSCVAVAVAKARSAALIQPLASELPDATGMALKTKTEQNKTKQVGGKPLVNTPWTAWAQQTCPPLLTPLTAPAK